MSKTSMDINSWELENKAFKVFENTDLGQTLVSDVEDISSVLKLCILKKLKETYSLAGEISEPQKHFKTFQHLLIDFKDWDLKTRKRFYRSVKKKSNNIKYLIKNSIVGASQIRFAWFANTKGINKKDCRRVLQAISISRQIPKVEDFLHWCCCHSIKEVYNHPYLFDNRNTTSSKKKKENEKKY